MEAEKALGEDHNAWDVCLSMRSLGRVCMEDLNGRPGICGRAGAIVRGLNSSSIVIAYFSRQESSAAVKLIAW